MLIIDENGLEREAASVTPDPTYPGFMKVQYRRHHEWIAIPTFLKLNPGLKHLADSAPPVPDDVVGVVTAAAKDTLQDTTRDWTPNAYMGMFVWISRGKGEGQKRTVLKNTKNKLVIDKPWDTKPAKNSQYVISYNIQDVKPMGNTLPITDIKDLEKLAIKMDRKRGRLNKDFKYLKPEEVD